ncbi:hypothetical protein [Ramlibacter tataouinensis]|uniref:Uncharacterized protein n=1 Tax=Ramlibacter tataouinensis TaxID=94132 RepID=A0A127JP71_9BURK|nr:hypothetical protein [Ramlibacter tataouinensis]AMO21683.1 hypothetical protein UC35_00850 [Ramlibacter tataouinensis]
MNAIINSYVIGCGTNYTLSATASNGDHYGVTVKKSCPYTSRPGHGGVDELKWLTMNDKPVMVEWYADQPPYPNSMVTVTFNTSPFLIDGLIENATGFGFAESHTPPATAKVGDSGVLFVLNNKVIHGNTAEEEMTEWSVDPATADTAWFCLNERRRITVGTAAPTYSAIDAKECAQVTPSGAVIGYKVDVNDPEVGSLRFR